MSNWEWKDLTFRYKSLFYDGEYDGESEIVLISHVLPHPVNEGYQRVYGSRVTGVNGVAVKSLKQALAGFESSVNGCYVIEIDNHAPRNDPHSSDKDFGFAIVIDAEYAAKSSADLISRYGIDADKSEDLKDPQRGQRG